MRWILPLLLIACSSSTPPTPTPSTPTPTTPTTPAPASTDAGDTALPSAPAPPPPITIPAEPDAALAKRIDPVVARAIAEEQLVGVVVMIARDGKLVYAKAAGFADREAKLPMREDTLFRMASMTKPVTAVTALVLVDHGKLGLDDPVTKYLPQFRPKLANGKDAVITIRQLLTHTSGLGYRFTEGPDGPYHKAGVSDGLGEPGLAAATNLLRLASVPLLSEPGTAWHYGLSLDVLGEVIAVAGGASFPEVMKALVLRPLRMDDTAFSVTDRKRLAWPYLEGKPPSRMTEPTEMKRGGGAITFSPARIFDSGSFPSGGAGLAGTAHDYLAFLEALRRGGTPILEPETTSAMASNQVGTLPIRVFGPGRRQGFAVGVVVDPKANGTKRGQGTIYGGGVYGTGYWVDPVAKLSVVMLTNVAGDTPFDRQLDAAIYAK